jgi:peptidoglycan biosynthesis protein MviN/MurJ (putative lipid II flippase)
LAFGLGVLSGAGVGHAWPVADRGAAGGDLGRAGVVAVGTLVSRVTGFVRTVMVLAALGAGLVGDAYASAKALPDAVYDLLLGGVLSSVLVLLLVTARHQDDCVTACLGGILISRLASQVVALPSSSDIPLVPGVVAGAALFLLSSRQLHIHEVKIPCSIAL